MPSIEEEEDSRNPNSNPRNPNSNPRNPNSNPRNPNCVETTRKRRGSLSETWLYRMQQFQISDQQKNPKIAETLIFDVFSLISDELLFFILSRVPVSQHFSNSLVCKRWCFVSGRIVRSLRVFDWDFVDSGRLVTRFSDLVEVDLVNCCFKSVGGSGILFSNKFVSVRVVEGEVGVLSCDLVDRGLKVVANGCPNLRRLVLVNGSEHGLGYVAEKCFTLQELEIHCCNDMALRSISGFKNLQILKLIACVNGLYRSVVTDIGLTILAQGCRRLVKLELNGCEGSYDGIKAIGQCCHMLEELTLCAHKMDGGWLSGISYCANLKTLKIQSCDNIDSSPGPDEHLGSCPTLEELYLERCHLGDKDSTKALFIVCETVREISFQDCWGLEDDVFRFAAICRRVNSLSLEGCSLLTTEGLDSVVHTWKELLTLIVVSCNNIKDVEITPELATFFSALKELKWRPDSKSLLASSLAGTGVGKKGGRFFKRV